MAATKTASRRAKATKKADEAPAPPPAKKAAKKVAVPKKAAAEPKAKKAPKVAVAPKKKEEEEPMEVVEDVPKVSAAKRKRPASETAPENKRAKLGFFGKGHAKAVALTLGQGDTGQLGLGEDIMERAKPALVKELGPGVVEIVAGGMHSAVLNHNGEVYTFGCNDEGGLGRITEDDDECYLPGKVDIPAKVVQITAGDSHSCALTEDGKVYYWGTFRDGSGSFGLTPAGIAKTPLPLAHHLFVRKIASGSDHVALLTEAGEIYTVGTAEQGQLGRVGERFVARGGRRGLELLLAPDKVHAKKRSTRFKDVWAGSYSTYALTNADEMLVCGLNNYNQLGVEKGQLFFTLVKSESFSKIAKESGWDVIAPGQHHAICLDKKNRAYAVGRVEYGRLGLGEAVKTDAKAPTQILTSVSHVSAGTAVSFAVKENGEGLSWGMGTNGQLGHAEAEEDAWTPTSIVGKQLETRKVLMVSGGGQHTMILAEDK